MKNHCVLRGQITKERLESIVGVGEVEEAVMAQSECEVWCIEESGVVKLQEYGYAVSAVPVQDKVFLAMKNRDETIAREDIDPRSITVVRVVSVTGALTTATAKRVLTEMIVPVVQRDVMLVCHGAATVHAAVGAAFEIRTLCSSETGEFEWPVTCWGQPTQTGQDKTAVGVCMDGEPIFCAEGEEVGALLRRTVYFYIDPFKNTKTGDEAENMLRTVCAAIISKLRNERTSGDESIRAGYISRCAARATARKKALMEKTASAETKVEEAQKVLANLLREHRDTQKELSCFGDYERDLRTTLGREFDKLVSLPFVQSVAWRGERLVVHTSDVYAVDPRSGNEHHIGQFQIVIDSRSATITFFNKMHRINGFQAGMHAPHVFATGKPCLGNMQEVIPRLVAQYEWSAAIHMGIHFLRSVNVDDPAGKHIDKWPISRTKAQIAAATALAALGAAAER